MVAYIRLGRTRCCRFDRNRTLRCAGSCGGHSHARSPNAMESWQFVRFNTEQKVVDVNEFQIAQALLAGDIRVLAQEVESQHLFSWCIKFGKQDTAVELLRRGVPGCVVEAEHLGPFARWGPVRGAFGCGCGSSWWTCSCCCFGGDPASGVWMKDWAAGLAAACDCAKQAMEQPVAHMLGALLSEQSLQNMSRKRPWQGFGTLPSSQVTQHWPGAALSSAACHSDGGRPKISSKCCGGRVGALRLRRLRY